MTVYALADLHLSFLADKPMDRFGDQWVDHPRKIEEGWRAVVGPDDTVLLAGDISWAMSLKEAEPDLRFIHELPGRKIMIRGNHDYWWDGIMRLRRAMPPSIELLQNDVTQVEGWTIAAARGWSLPVADPKDPVADKKIYERERNRLRLSLGHVPKGAPVIVMMHFPPFIMGQDHPGFRDILEEHGVQTVVYGHFHGPDQALTFQGTHRGIRYIFCAADCVGFRPIEVCASAGDEGKDEG